MRIDTSLGRATEMIGRNCLLMLLYGLQAAVGDENEAKGESTFRIRVWSILNCSCCGVLLRRRPQRPRLRVVRDAEMLGKLNSMDISADM